MKHQEDGAEDMIALFNLYEQKMYHIAFSILHDSFQAEDAVMDAFVRLLEKQYHVDDPESDSSKCLIIQVIRCAAIDLYRKNRREQERLSLAEDPVSFAPARTTGTNPCDENMENMIDDLPSIYRDVLYYRYFKDCTTAQTAQALNISQDAVRKRLERAIKMLRNEANSKGGFFNEYHFRTTL